jgi:hypothetical protein
MSVNRSPIFSRRSLSLKIPTSFPLATTRTQPTLPATSLSTTSCNVVVGLTTIGGVAITWESCSLTMLLSHPTSAFAAGTSEAIRD